MLFSSMGCEENPSLEFLVKHLVISYYFPLVPRGYGIWWLLNTEMHNIK